MNPPNSISTALQYQRTGRVAEAEQVYKLLLKDQPHSVDALNLLGALVYDDQRFSEAEAYFAQVLTLQPGAESHNSLGIVLKAQGKYEAAVEHYQQALALKPNQPEVLSNLGNALKETGQLEAAIAAYQQAIAINPNYAEAYNNLGIAYKEQNDLAGAIACYEQAIRLKPNYPESHHNLGIILRLQNQLDEAIAYFQQAIAFKPTYAEAYISLGSTLQQQGQFEAAIAQYQRLIEIKPDSADGYNNLGLAYQQQQQVEAAIAAFQQALALRPQFPGVRNNLGNLLLEANRLDEAIASYAQAIEQRPNYPEAINNLGNALQQKGDLDAAIEQYRQALELRPNFVEALSNLGAVLKDKHQLEESIACLEQAIALNPDIAEVQNNLGNAYQEQKRVEDAIACYRKALALKPEMAEVRSNLGNMLQYIGEFEEAFEHFAAAIAAQPDFAGAYNNLGIAYRNAGRVEDAFAAYDRALELKPDFVEAHWNKGLNYLLLGDFDRGFAGYEWRFQWSRFLEQNPSRTYSQPRWDGSDLTGKVILLYAEQGMGDTIQFIRYVPLVKAKGGHLIVECHPPLLNLLQCVPEIDKLLPLGSVVSGFDVHAPLMSLPYLLGTTATTVPAEVPYLQAASKPPYRLDQESSGYKIGIVWDGNPQNPYNRMRTVPLAELLRLADLPGVTLYSLQKEPKPADVERLQAHPQVQDLRSHLADFTDTAALIEQLDLVISIDTAVAHLAGALAKPTWLLLPLAPDWRWMCDRLDSPWYPTMRLFRQPTYGDWPTVLQQVRQALVETLGIDQQTVDWGADTAAIAPPELASLRQGKPQKPKAPTQKRKEASKKNPPSKASSPPKPVLPAALQAVVKLYQTGQLAAARQNCQAFLDQHPDSADGWHLLGLMSHHERQLETAIAHYQQALKVNTNHLDTYNNLAVALHELGQLDEAIPHYQKALALNPQSADAHNNYANALRERGRLDEAITHYQQAIAARPEYADAYNNLGLAYYAQEDFEQAAIAYRQAVERRPHFPQALNHLGNALKELGDFAAAAHAYQQAIACKPDYAKAYNNWGNVFRDSGDLQTAVQYYDQATAIEPNFAEAHWNKALTLLLGGDLLRGFEEYEWRRHVNLPSFRSLRDFPGTRWDGSPLQGQIIYLHAEQGMGDIIQFVRYVPYVVQRGGRVMLECHPPLMNLLQNLPGVERLVPYGSAPPGYHTQAPLLSLAHIFQTTAETVPASVPYLHPPATAVTLPPPHAGTASLKVGLVWSGNPENPYNRTRAIPLELLLPFADLPHIALYSLQKDLQPGEADQLAARPQIHDLRSRLSDFVDTAALIQQLDLIISIDTAVTHLAGALGKPVWLLLPFAPDWRWMLHRDDSPWYPTLRIFRQAVAGDWETVLQQVSAELEQLAAAPAPPPLPKAALPLAATDFTQPPLSSRSALLLTALQQYQTGNLAAAEQLYRQVLAHHPEETDALHVLGVILCQRQQFDEAIALIRRLVALKPEFVEGWRNLAGALQDQRQFEAAIASYQQALNLYPDYADVHQNLSTALLEVDRPFAAVTHAQRLVDLKPDSADAYYNLGYALRRAGQVDAAIECYRQAIARQPDMAIAHKNLGHALLLQGDLIPGFAAIEWRWQQPGWTRRPFPQPEWDGGDLTGKTILLYAEQGLGDTLQFIRYVPLVKAKGGRIIVECQADLISLLAQLADCDRLIPQDAPLPPFDVHASLMSLPRLLQTTAATIPAEIPYLWASAETQPPEAQPAETEQPFTPAAPLPTSPLKVGVVWAGNPNHRNDRFRSCAVEVLRPLFEVANVNFYSLQKGAAAEQLRSLTDLPIEDWGDRLQTFVDTANAIAALDLVITVDTAVAHLAGAMGKPVWVLLMFAADWRWMLDRDDTPWYPTMRLFRQTEPGDWAGLLARVQQALTQAVAASGRQTAREPSLPPVVLAPVPAAPETLCFAWPLDDRSDWGIVGTAWVLQLLQNGGAKPVLDQALAMGSHGNPLVRSRLQALVSTAPATGWRIVAVGDRADWGEALANPAMTVALVARSQTNLAQQMVEQLRAVRAIGVGSTWGAEQLRQQGLPAVQVPLLGVDPLLCERGHATGMLRDRFVIFSNATTDIQGLDLVLSAFRGFQARHPEALLLLTGEPLSEVQRAEWSTEAVWQLGTIAYPLWGQVLREVDVALFPSRCETGVNQMIAASLASGIPTVLSNNTANRDLIQHNLGFPLHAQRPVKLAAYAAANCVGWGESDGEEIIETLEYIYTHRREAGNRGAIAADFMRQWTWERQWQALMALVCRW